MTRTFTSAVRLLETLALFGSDFRVGTVFAHDGSSAFSVGVPDLLRTAGIIPAPLAELTGARFDLALTASENVDLGQVKAPLVVLPHGIGFHRYVPDSASAEMRLSGLVPLRRLRDADAWMAVAHPGQREQLRAEYPEAADRCVVVGDLAFDRMAASLPLRGRYRRQLGVGPGQRLVAVTSTWGAGSLIQAWPDLPARLVGELPHDEYKVVLVLHPNVWSWHGAYTVRLWLADARAAGLMVMPPSGGWQAALVAADAVIGDHGSVTLYGAALGRPVLLAGDPSTATVVPGTPPTELAGTAARLLPGLPLAGQLDAAITGYRKDQFAALADGMFARRGEAARALRDFLYARLALDVPDTDPALTAAEDPEPERSGPSSFVVYSVSEGDQVRLWRFPAAVRNAGLPDPAAERHLCVEENEPDRRLPANASVIIRRAPASPAQASAWISEALRQYPGCLIAAVCVADGYAAGLRDGQRIRLTVPHATRELGVSALYARLRTGQPTNGAITVHAGAASFTASLAPWTA